MLEKLRAQTNADPSASLLMCSVLNTESWEYSSWKGTFEVSAHCNHASDSILPTNYALNPVAATEVLFVLSGAVMFCSKVFINV